MADAKSKGGARAARPLSPHLQVYRFEVNMLMSIVHRITGAGLYLGLIIMAWVLLSASVGPDYFAYVTGLLGTPIGLLILIGYTWALFHHMLGGVRHFIWDTGRGFDLKTVDLMAWGTLAGSLLLTAVVWLYLLFGKG